MRNIKRRTVKYQWNESSIRQMFKDYRPWFWRRMNRDERKLPIRKRIGYCVSRRFTSIVEAELSSAYKNFT